MMSVQVILEAIQGLPIAERRRLHEYLTRELENPAPEPPGADEDPYELIGFLADYPEIADEIEKIATVERRGIGSYAASGSR